MKSFEAQILTPDGPVFKGAVEGIILPGTEGNFQVLSAHASLMSALDIGEITVMETATSKIRFAVTGGFAEVHEDKVIVLAEAAERAEQINFDRALEAKKRAEERLKKTDVDTTRAEASLRRAMNRIKVARN